MASQQLQPELTAGMERTRIVTVNFAQLNGTTRAKPTSDNIADSLILNLFDGTELLAVRDKLQQNASGSYTWIGHIDGEPLSQAILVVRDNTLFGGIQVPGIGEFAIQPLGSSYHLIQEAGSDTILPKDDTHVAVVDSSVQSTAQQQGAAQGGAIIQAAPGSTADNGSLIDVLVVYSDDVTPANAQSFAEMFIAYTNQAYENSGINQRVWLVDTEQFTYNETGSLSSDLNNITNQSNPNVLAHRNQYHADLVLFFVNNDGSSTSCSGLAWLQTSVTPSFESSGYSVMKACSFGSSVFAHELGHNMGSRHDWYMDAGTTPFTYAHGYVDITRRFRTIMSYNNRCSALGYNCDGIPYFSNPTVNYNGFTTGVAGGTASNCATNNSTPTTECDADERRTFNETAANTAGFRSSQLTWTGAVSNDWSNAANWTIAEGVPSAATATARAPRSIDNIYIPSGITRMPVISSGTVTAREVVIANGATLQMSGGTLMVGWRWQDSGGFQGTGGTVIFSGPLDIAVTSASGSSFKDVQIGDGVSTPDITLNSNLDINGNLTIKSGAQLKPGSYTINLAGNWSDEGNGLTPGTSTVIFDGTTQSVNKVTTSTLINQNFNSYTTCCGWNGSGYTPPTGWERQSVGAGSGWLLGDQGATRAGNSTDGWLFTAGVSLQPNVQYQISYDLAVLDQPTFGVINPQNVTVIYGTSQNASGAVATVDTATTSSESSASRTATFTVATAGTYYIGFRATQTTTGDWFILDNVVLTSSQNLLFYNVQVASGTTTFNQAATVQNNLSVNASSTANLGANTVTVEGAVTNNGTLQQTKTVASGGATAFLNLKNAAGTSDKYYGVEITPAGNMGSTIVAIRGNQSCTEGGGATDTVKRCYDITPTTSQSATIRFYYRTAEQNGEAQPNVYHYSGTGAVWNLQTLVNRGGSGEGLWVTASNISSYSPFRLDDVTSATSTPTATATDAATPTPTNTPTNTPTPTNTSVVPTNTSTNTPTNTPTPTNTSVVPTSTPTNTSTNTPTNTPTPTNTSVVPTSTPTNTPTNTPTPTNTSVVPTNTPTSTPSNTPISSVAAPTALQAAVTSSSRIALSWQDQSNNESGFVIERCEGSACTNFSEIASVKANNTQYTNKSLKPGTYCYRIKAYNAQVSSAYTMPVCATIPPEAPSSLRLTTISEQQINLTWSDKSSSETGFAIERCQNSGCTNFVQIATVGANVTSYQDTALSANTYYRYRIQAYNGSSASAYSSQVGRTTGPVPPSNLTANATSQTQITLGWSDGSTNESGFQIERCIGNNCTDFARVTTTKANVVTYLHKKLTANTTYCYRIRSTNNNGASSYTASVCAITALSGSAETPTTDSAEETAEDAATGTSTLRAYQVETTTGELSMLAPQGTPFIVEQMLSCADGQQPLQVLLVVNEQSYPMQRLTPGHSRYGVTVSLDESWMANSSYPLDVNWQCTEEEQWLTTNAGILHVITPVDGGAAIEEAQPLRIYLPLIEQ